MNPVEIFAKDDIELRFLSDSSFASSAFSALLDGSAELTVYLESDGREVPFAELRAAGAAAGGRHYRCNNFSVTENPAGGSVIFRPVVVGCLAVFSVTITPQFAGSARLDVRRAESETPVYTFPLGAGKNRFALSPVDMKKYLMKAEIAGDNLQTAQNELPPPALPAEPSQTEPSQTEPSQRRDRLLLENAALQGDVTLLEREIAELEARGNAIAQRKETLVKNIKWLSARAEDGGAQELEELKAALDIDADVLACYLEQGGKDAEDAEKLLAEVKAGIEKLEGQIRAFVMTRQRKNLDIENKLKAGARK